MITSADLVQSEHYLPEQPNNDSLWFWYQNMIYELNGQRYLTGEDVLADSTLEDEFVYSNYLLNPFDYEPNLNPDNQITYRPEINVREYKYSNNGVEFYGYEQETREEDYTDFEFGNSGEKGGYAFDSTVIPINIPSFGHNHTPVEVVEVKDNAEGKAEVKVNVNENFIMPVTHNEIGEDDYYSDKERMQDLAFTTVPLNYEVKMYEDDQYNSDGGREINQIQNFAPQELTFTLDNSMYSEDLNLKFEVYNENPFDQLINRDLNDNERMIIDEGNNNSEYKGTTNININSKRNTSEQITMNQHGDTTTFSLPTEVVDGEMEYETFEFKNLTNGTTSHPRPINELIEIKVNSSYPEQVLNINSVDIRFNNGSEPLNVKTKGVQEGDVYKLVVDGTYYYDHYDKKVTDVMPPSGHNFDTYVNEVPMPLDYKNNMAYIELDLDVNTYTSVNYQINLETSNTYPLRDDENAIFNINVTQGDFNTDNMKHVKTLRRNGFKHISEITNELVIRAK